MDRTGGLALGTGLERGRSSIAAGNTKQLLGFCLAALVVMLLSIGPPGPRDRDGRASTAVSSTEAAAPSPIVPLPVVGPTVPLALTPDAARQVNASIPFVDGPISPARKFSYSGSAEDRERALICLASAAWYEAGDDKIGEQAVAQVVLNRLRHPAFPKTVCGVVFEGATRKTGCQFTFTCDGSLARIPSLEAWQRARAVADDALSGHVFKQVGNATHYHTDWVVPYWSGTLDKLAAVDTHLFYRWRGWWGTAGAFTGRPGGTEELDPRIAYLAFKTPVLQPLTLSTLAAAASKGLHIRSPIAIAAARTSYPPPTTILPLAPDAPRRVLPPVAGLTPPRPSNAAPVLAPAQPRATMSFNLQAKPDNHWTGR